MRDRSRKWLSAVLVVVVLVDSCKGVWLGRSGGLQQVDRKEEYKANNAEDLQQAVKHRAEDRTFQVKQKKLYTSGFPFRFCIYVLFQNHVYL